MKKATLFFAEQHITTIDHAYIDEHGGIVGGSIAPAFEVTGNVENSEQVVIDFSSCKKQIKAIIDDNEKGMDHKLLIGEWSNVESIERKAGIVKVQTPKWQIAGPANMFHFIDKKDCEYYDNLDLYVGKLVEREMKEQYPSIEVRSSGGTKAGRMPWHDKSDLAMFRYSHGLKNSSSWGCGNIAHGHLSYVVIDGEDPIGSKILAQKIASNLDKMMFVFADNIIETSKDRLVVWYHHCLRGNFRLETQDASNVIVTAQETTIENLVEMIANLYVNELKEVKAYRLFVSEGLFKGAVKDLNPYK